MKTVKVTANWIKELQLEATARSHKVIIDQPPTDLGPNPMEYLLFSLGGCIGTVASIISRQERIDLRGFSVEMEADFDPDYLFGRTTEGRAGYTEIRVKVNIDADLTDEERMAYIEKIDARCPISCNVGNTTPIKFTLV